MDPGHHINVDVVANGQVLQNLPYQQSNGALARKHRSGIQSAPHSLDIRLRAEEVDILCDGNEGRRSVVIGCPKRERLAPDQDHAVVGELEYPFQWRGIVDVVSEGFPCQDISVAGPNDGLDGERSGVWYEMARVVREVEPE